MTAADCNNFDWEELLSQINRKNVIPVLGKGIYWVKNEEEKEVLLYDYLAEKLALHLNRHLPATKDCSFSKLAFQFLWKNGYSGLNKFLNEWRIQLRLSSDDTLKKLAQIKPFSLIINTTYDDFLEQALNKVRCYPTRMLAHTYLAKRANDVTRKMLNSAEIYHSSLLLHLFGSAAKCQNPSYLEKDILETVVTFQKDMETNRLNPFFQTLQEKSLLFIGCRYDDWLFRFFIRTMANEPYQNLLVKSSWIFVSDDFDSSRNSELKKFLETHDTEIFYPGSVKEFVDLLYEKINCQYPTDIIQENDFPATVFISFHGDNRATAAQLTSQLLEDGIHVWIDQNNLNPGDSVDVTIAAAIDKCQIFIPLISNESKQVQKGDNTQVNYHIKEWDYAHFRRKRGENPKVIIPVYIDDTDWKYGNFSDDVFVRIPGGNKSGQYENLKNDLLKRQNNPR